jgi:hypothetical protein
MRKGGRRATASGIRVHPIGQMEDSTEQVSPENCPLASKIVRLLQHNKSLREIAKGVGVSVPSLYIRIGELWPHTGGSLKRLRLSLGLKQTAPRKAPTKRAKGGRRCVFPTLFPPLQTNRMSPHNIDHVLARFGYSVNGQGQVEYLGRW